MVCTTRFAFLIGAILLVLNDVINANSNEIVDSDVGELDVKVFTVASEDTEGYLRYIRSANYYNVEVETLGMHEEWQGGSMESYGGGYKINLLREALEPYKNDDQKIILFTDSYDVLFTTTIDVIVHKFKKFDARILFGAEKYLWPDTTVEHLYPTVSKHLPKYLNSGLFMGYASNVYEMLSIPVKNKDDDQLYYTKAFLDASIRKKLQIKLDHESEIFQNLNGASGDVRVQYNEATGEYFIKNIQSDSTPSLIHGNGPSKILLNNFGGYVAGAFKHNECQLCQENKLDYSEKQEDLPKVTIAVAIPNATPFLEEFFDSILALDYPKEKLNIFIYNNVQYHDELVQTFLETHGATYAGTKQIKHTDSYKEAIARNLAVNYAERERSDYLFVVDAEAHIDNPSTLIRLVEQNRNVIAPVMTRYESSWSNFWGSLSEKGFYARSHDYMQIVKNEIRGLWNVPFISSCYLIKKAVFPKITYADDDVDPDMAMCKNLRAQQIFLYVYNAEYYGHLVNNEDYNPALTNPEFYMLITNQMDWENRYLHRDYINQLKPNQTYKQPCPDVYWFPVANERFCDDLVKIVETFGKWSDGTNHDERLNGGYEAVPTRDIHMSQVGLENVWLTFLNKYVRPLQEAVFMGYYHNPVRSIMNFVVRYRPDEQPTLRPHHDSSTYTINIALNTVGVDYEGGGCHFLRYNCSVTATQKGWMLMHPGRLTHFHEGLRTTSGTRYIMISFVDP
ncbi:procollagen-lysine,2-oxoglutarate 5-dioxygenase isoform X2 [Sitodiplosis mosellana]|uniref:procollagen-lysine,2-oxoglutarate 5-dioxygenase isoform X2 n=1 Tax=Sitodiplosis mosellana TaxID=263140 RepID=UPI0024447AE1|nr:procollagen-lysine,2-oxoglutarate 5-dioxygenase isoform X2 [Sitodiplosis mosellana]